MLNPAHLKLYRSLALLFLKYGRSDLVKNAGLESALDGETPEAPVEATPEATALAADLESLGPTFVKLGQLLSTRPDLLPAPYIEALSRLQDKLAPFPFAEVDEIVESELGVPLAQAFAEFRTEPMAAASLGQVHRATLHDGRCVVVKIQRAGIRKRILQDMDALEEIASFVEKHSETGQRYGFLRMLQEFRKNILHELDYQREASNLATLGSNLVEFENIVVPEAVDELTTSRVLTMQYIRGRKINEITPLARVEMNGELLADELFQAYLKQILVDGFFHADPHPGNVFLADDGRVALLDLGMVGRIAPTLQDRLLRLMLAMGEGNGHEAARVAIDIGEPLEGLFNAAGFTHEVAEMVSRFYGATAREIQMGRMVIDLARMAAVNGLRLPGEISTLGRAFLALDEAGRTLDPEFDPNAAIRRHSSGIMQQRMRQSASPANMFASLLELNEFVQRLPGRMNRVLDAVADNDVEVGIRLREERWLMAGLQKISNRITMGLVLAALIIGAAMLVRVDTPFRILGYPGLAIILFLAAGTLGIFLVLSILLNDVREGDGPGPR